MAVALALFAAFTYGVADYIGGKAARLGPAVLVTLVAEITTFFGVAVALGIIGDPLPRGSDLGWGALAGVCSVVGVLALYYALARGAMTVVAPVTGVVAASLPVVVGLATGERPGVIALVGVVIAIASVALISGAVGAPPHQPTSMRIVLIALLAGAAFGSLFVFFDRASDDSGLWPVFGARLVALPLISLVVLIRGLRGSLGSARRAVAIPGIGVGVMTLAANVSYLAATRRGLLTIVAVVVSMYPASTVLLATAIDHERLRRPQAVGLALAAGALVLVTLGR
ncbi:MAG TPA: DMT family transporter [Ilumatobacteraceae bacterium]